MPSFTRSNGAGEPRTASSGTTSGDVGLSVITPPRIVTSLSLLVAAIAVASMEMRLFNRELLYTLAREDGPYEDFEAAAYFLSAFLLLRVASARGARNLWVLGLAVLSLRFWARRTTQPPCLGSCT